MRLKEDRWTLAAATTPNYTQRPRRGCQNERLSVNEGREDFLLFGAEGALFNRYEERKRRCGMGHA